MMTTVYEIRSQSRPAYRRPLAFALALLMIFGAMSGALLTAGCGDKPEEPPAGEVTTAAPALDVGLFTLVRKSDDAFGSEIIQAAAAGITKKCGLSLKLRDDFVREGAIEAAEYEILLGDCNREETRTALSGLGHTEWIVTVIGKRIVVAGASDAGTRSALDEFISGCLGADGKLLLADGERRTGNVTYENFDERLVGLEFNILGDSYVAGDALDISQTWAGLLADKYNWTYRNYGRGGNGVCSTLASGTPMYIRYTEMAKTADIVFVVGGRNDYNKQCPIGNVSDTTGDTFCGAINILIDGLRVKYPDSLILFATCWYVNGDMLAYSNAMTAVCTAKGVPCLDCGKPENCGVDMSSSAFRLAYSVDGTSPSHLNLRGMEKCMPYFEKFIIAEYEKHLASK